MIDHDELREALKTRADKLDELAAVSGVSKEKLESFIAGEDCLSAVEVSILENLR